MANITKEDANAWLESTKLALTTLNAELEAQVSNLVMSRLLGAFDTTAWTSPTNTPQLVRTLIAMHYVAWTYDKYYSDDAEANAYARNLRTYADANIEALVSGSVELVEDPDANVGVSSPSFYPNDLSSSQRPTPEFPSDGGPAFMMGTVF